MHVAETRLSIGSGARDAVLGAKLKRIIWATLFAACLLVGNAHAVKRVALVIGNGDYAYAPMLVNPRNDASDMAQSLRTIGFEVIEGFDLEKSAMDAKVREFARSATDAEIVLFFYAGHGMQVNGSNYLLPTDAQLLDSSALDFETIELDRITRNMQSPAKTALIFLDACRNNPLTRNFVQAIGSSRAIGAERGLAPTSMPGDGLFIAFATAPNDVALDGVGRNSPFTHALLKHITSPTLEIQQVMTRVKADVHTATNGRQRPWHNSDLRSEIYLARASSESDPGASAEQLKDAEHEELWAFVEQTGSLEVIEVFLKRYPYSIHASQARQMLNSLGTTGGAANQQTAFVGPGDPTSPPAAADPATAFEKAQKISTIRGWDRFLTLYGNSPYRTEALKFRAQVLSGLRRSSPPEKRERDLALTPDQRRQIQSRLAALGYAIGNPDGLFGPRTRSEISAYQRAEGMPATGFVDQALLSSDDFSILAIRPGEEPTVFDPAKALASDDLAALETDERILRAADCFRGAQISYADFEGHLYVSVYQAFVSWKHASRVSGGCGGYLVAIGSERENNFVYQLIANDEKMFQIDFDGQKTYRQGPWIGLVQDQNANEPAGGWSWSNGERLVYTNWGPGEPDGSYSGDDYAVLFGSRRGRSDGTDLVARYWEDKSVGSRVRGFIVEFE